MFGIAPIEQTISIKLSLISSIASLFVAFVQSKTNFELDQTILSVAKEANTLLTNDLKGCLCSANQTPPSFFFF